MLVLGFYDISWRHFPVDWVLLLCCEESALPRILLRAVVQSKCTEGYKRWKGVEKRETKYLSKKNISRSTGFFSHCWSFCSMSVKMWMCSVSPCMSFHLVFLDCRQISFCVWPYITELDFHALRILYFGTCNTGNSQLLGKIKSPCRNLLFVSKCKRGGIVRLFIAQAAWRACCRSWEQLEMLRCSTSACDF